MNNFEFSHPKKYITSFNFWVASPLCCYPQALDKETIFNDGKWQVNFKKHSTTQEKRNLKKKTRIKPHTVSGVPRDPKALYIASRPVAEGRPGNALAAGLGRGDRFSAHDYVTLSGLQGDL